MKLFACALVCLLAATVGLPASAHTVAYQAILSGPAESPPNASPGVGLAVITFDLDLVTMRVQANFVGLLGPTTANHIHCCTAVAGVANAGVATQVPSFLGFPLGVTAGTYDHTFDMTLASSYNPAFITANGGTVATALNALLIGLDAGKAYYNIHTALPNGFPGGEIRGFLLVPEPGTLALLGIGLAGLALAGRARR